MVSFYSHSHATEHGADLQLQLGVDRNDEYEVPVRCEEVQGIHRWGCEAELVGDDDEEEAAGTVDLDIHCVWQSLVA